MAPDRSTLGKRGAELAAGPNLRDSFGTILGDTYDKHSNAGGIINIGTAENYVMLEDVAGFLKQNPVDIPPEIFSYGEGPWGPLLLRKAMAKHMNKHFKPTHPVSQEDLLFSTGCTTLMDMLGHTLMDPDDGILITMPSYTAFQSDFSLRAKCVPVLVPFHGVDQFSPDAIAKYEEALQTAKEKGITTRALMLCHPHNPLGQPYPKETLIALMQFCSKHTLHLISDEIYALSVYDVPGQPDTVPFQSVLSFDTKPYIDEKYLHVLYGFSKDLACGGLRLGVLYTRNPELLRAMSAITQLGWAGAVDAQIAIHILENEQWLDGFLATSKERLAKANGVVRQILDQYQIPYNRKANAGFFMWVDLRSYLPNFLPKENDVEGITKGLEVLRFEDRSDEEKKALWKAEERLQWKLVDNKVFIMAGGMQAAEEPGFFRVIFSHDEDIIRKGLERAMKALKE